jgi:two-component system, cell cycle response regulator
MTAPNARTRRGRVLLVGGGELERLGETLERPTAQVGDLFEAIGEIAIATAQSPIDAVIVSRHAAGNDPDEAARALRRVDPSVRLVLMTNGSGGSDGAAAAFDARIAAGTGPAEITRVLDSDAPEIAEAPSAVSATTHAGQQPAPVEGAPMEHAPLGDTDLVEAVLAGAGHLPELALRLIGEQTGWPDVKLIAPGEAPPAGRAAVRVGEGDEAHGLLTTERATAAELQPWAEWLSRWLTLDARYQRNRMCALQDELTGAWNRRYFMSFLEESIRRASRRRRPITVMVFDIDDFKRYNDSYGHAAGDEILIETVRLLSSVIRRGDRVCRIGGDEFAVIFADIDGPRLPGSAHPETVEQIAQRFQDEICRMHFPKLGDEAPGSLTISAGLATYPWDGRDPRSLLEHADQLALQSKRKGKNVITLGPGAAQICRKPRGA